MNIFELLYIAWKREKQSPNLESLENNFFSKIKPYITHLEAQYINEKDKLISSLFRKRWERANYMINDLINLRSVKHFKDIINGISSPDILPTEEIEFRQNIVNIQNKFRNKILNVEVDEEIHTDEDDGYSFILFNKNDDTISIGSDFRDYGPFLEKDIVLLPKENMRAYLIKTIGSLIEIN